jgi:hypothetical protein
MKRSSVFAPLFRKSAVLLTLPVLWACGPTAPEPETAPASQSLVSWEEFRRNATRVVDGRELYIVEWDQAVTQEELRQRYEAYVAAASGHWEEPVGSSEQPLIVNRVGTSDDIWAASRRFNLRYCISNNFGANKARAVAEMAGAAAAWESVADVDFIYDSTQDGNCANTNPAVTFAVQPWTGGGACAFFPSGGGCVARTVVMDFNDLDTNPFYDTNSPNVTTATVFIHELGHVLGFRHEHTRPESGRCFEDSNWRALTPYDRSSTMHYPWCNGQLTSTLNITPTDAQGAAQLYGWYTHTNNGDRRIPAPPQGDAFTYEELGQSFRLPLALTATYVDGCFYGTNAPTVVRIKAGDNVLGTVLATSTTIVDTGVPCGWGSAGYTWRRALFGGVSLAANTSYTATFYANGGVMGLIFNQSNPYSNGQMWDTYGGARSFPTWDAQVRIGRAGPP